MAAANLILIRKEQSKYSAPIDAAVSETYARRKIIVDRSPSGPPPAGSMAVWDMSGCNPKELESISQMLAYDDVGVLAVVEEPGPDECKAMMQCQALGLVARPKTPQAVSAALEIASGLHARLMGLNSRLSQLQQEMNDRDLIDQAKRLYMKAKNIGEAEAYLKMQKYSRDHNRKLADVAKSMLENLGLLNGG